MAQDNERRVAFGGDETGQARWNEEAPPPRAAMPVELGGGPGMGAAAPVTGERRLLAAILGGALNEVLQPRELANRQDGRRAERSRSEAREWLYSDDRSSPFSFLTICDMLGFEPDYLRSQVTRELRARDRCPGSRRAGPRPVSPVLRRAR